MLVYDVKNYLTVVLDRNNSWPAKNQKVSYWEQLLASFTDMSLLFSFCDEDCIMEIQVEYGVCVGQCTIALGHSADVKWGFRKNLQQTSNRSEIVVSPIEPLVACQWFRTKFSRSGSSFYLGFLDFLPLKCTGVHVYKNGAKLQASQFKTSYLKNRKWGKSVVMNTFVLCCNSFWSGQIRSLAMII